MIDNDLLLFIEPISEPSKLPLIDGLTLKMTKALRRGIPGAQNEKWTPDSNRVYIKNNPSQLRVTTDN